MVQTGGNQDSVWSRMGAHEEFVELAAVSTSGNLTEEEKTKLRVHLDACPECREVLQEYQATAAVSLPLLVAGTREQPSAGTQQWSFYRAQERLQQRLKRERNASRSIESAKDLPERQQDDRPLQLSDHWNHVWIAFAAAVLLAATLAICAYEVGVKRSDVVVRKEQMVQPPNRVSKQSSIDHDPEIRVTQLAERDRVIDGLRRQLVKQTSELKEIKVQQAILQAASGRSEEEKRGLATNQTLMTQKLEATELALRNTEKELEIFKRQYSQGEESGNALQAKIGRLGQELRDKEGTIDQLQEMLAHDRDIRELMGARELYIAEVFDIAKTGATQKPYGRVFFTKGKSLIFYAFDLDRQSGFKNSKSFQAWGQRGTDREDSLSLGVFYEDNVLKKRWVVKFDDPQKLDQIDSVFVTLEPRGGSQRPSGKPLLFAYLKVRPNHP